MLYYRRKTITVIVLEHIWRGRRFPAKHVPKSCIFAFGVSKEKYKTVRFRWCAQTTRAGI